MKEARRSWSGVEELGEGLVRGNYVCKGPVAKEWVLLWRNSGKAGESGDREFRGLGERW